jgi:hypothetical protein
MKTHIGRAGARGGMLVALASACIWSCGTSGGTASPPSSGSDNSSGTGGGSTTASGTGSGNSTASGGGSGVSSGTGTGGSSIAGGGSSVSSVSSSSDTGGGASSSSAATVAGGDGGGTGSSGSSSGSPSSSGSTGTAPSGAVAFDSSRVVVTGLRGLATPAAKSMVNLHNGGSTAVTVTKLAFGGTTSLAANKTGGGAEYSMQTPTGQTLFETSTTLPATIMPGADLAVAVQMTTSGATLPAAPPGPAPYDAGCNLMTDTLTATLSSGSATATVYGLLLEPDSAVAAPPGGFSAFTSGYEATLGQILTTLGYQVNVGAAQTSWNPNTGMMATMLSLSNPLVPNEVATAGGALFVKAGAGMVTISVVARFSPQGSLPFGWYTPGAGTPMTTTVGTMQLQSDPQTSDLARIVYPPLTGTVSTGAPGSTKTFDPGSGSFGLWIYSDQATNKFNEGGKASNGDYDYSQDSLNTPANVHRVKVFPLADATGTAIPQSYLVAVEEASNGDYQDYVFVLSNVNLAP